MPSFGVDPVPSSSSTSNFERFSTTRREGEDFSFPLSDKLFERESDAKEDDNGGGTSEVRPIYSISSSSRDSNPILALELSFKGTPSLSSAPTSDKSIVHAALVELSTPP